MQIDRAVARAPGCAKVASLLGAIISFAAGAASAEGPLKLAGAQLEPVKWAELTGWRDDDHLAAFSAYQASCHALRKIRRTDNRGQISEALSNVCQKAMGLQPKDNDTARTFFEQNFRPVRIARLGEVEGLLTGYFEPIVTGSRFPSPEFHVPLYRRPRDLVVAGHEPGSVAFPNKGVRIGRRNEKNELVPYYDRAAIEAGALDGQKLEICWLRSSSDLLAIQIEGSGRVILEDGTPLRVSFDSHNGYRFSSIERVLVDHNLIPRKEVSTHRIREWMAAHPEEAAKVRAANQSFVFFRITGLTNDGEPVGAQEVPLTPGRSIAVDRVHQYGTPFFIEATLPIEGGKPASPFRRLMIAQDTGSAIIGPARADLYWGAGDDAGRIASRIRHPGRFVMLLPRELDIVVAGSEMPLPVAKPKFAAPDVTKEDGKSKTKSIGMAVKPHPAPAPKIAAIEVGKQNGNEKPNSVRAGAIRTIGLPVLKPKGSAIEVSKQDGKDNTDSATAAGKLAAGHHMPSPAHKSQSSERDVKKQQEGKGKANSVRPGAVSAWQKSKSSENQARKQASAPKQTISGLESKKQTAKAKRIPSTPNSG